MEEAILVGYVWPYMSQVKHFDRGYETSLKGCASLGEDTKCVWCEVN